MNRFVLPSELQKNTESSLEIELVAPPTLYLPQQYFSDFYHTIIPANFYIIESYHKHYKGVCVWLLSSHVVAWCILVVVCSFTSFIFISFHLMKYYNFFINSMVGCLGCFWVFFFGKLKKLIENSIYAYSTFWPNVPPLQFIIYSLCRYSFWTSCDSF